MSWGHPGVGSYDGIQVLTGSATALAEVHTTSATTNAKTTPTPPRIQSILTSVERGADVIDQRLVRR